MIGRRPSKAVKRRATIFNDEEEEKKTILLAFRKPLHHQRVPLGKETSVILTLRRGASVNSLISAICREWI